VNISIELINDQCIYQVENSKLEDSVGEHEKSGIGLQNVQRRLELSYPGKHLLTMENKQDRYVVKLNLTLN
jgi:LytS/YehU family sensor histidine kinase